VLLKSNTWRKELDVRIYRLAADDTVGDYHDTVDKIAQLLLDNGYDGFSVCATHTTPIAGSWKRKREGVRATSKEGVITRCLENQLANSARRIEQETLWREVRILKDTFKLAMGKRFSILFTVYGISIDEPSPYATYPYSRKPYFSRAKRLDPLIDQAFPVSKPNRRLSGYIAGMDKLYSYMRSAKKIVFRENQSIEDRIKVVEDWVKAVDIDWLQDCLEKHYSTFINPDYEFLREAAGLTEKEIRPTVALDGEIAPDVDEDPEETRLRLATLYYPVQVPAEKLEPRMGSLNILSANILMDSMKFKLIEKTEDEKVLNSQIAKLIESF
jgi:hypothetical protein